MEIAHYVPLIVFSIIAVLVAAAVSALGRLLGPDNPTREKKIPYESGSDPIGSPKDNRFAVRFYMVALSFILFDLEAVFVIPWTISWRQSAAVGHGMYSFGVMFIFVAILTLGLVYEWSEGGLEWD